MIKTILLIFLIFSSLNLYALELLLGVNIAGKSVEIKNKTDDEKISIMENDPRIQPTISLRTKQNYFNEGKSNFGYFYQFDWSVYEVDQQKINNKLKDLDTQLKGYSFYTVPTAYYHIYKDSKNWSAKLGLGLGLGYAKVTGNFEITNKKHPNYGTKQKADVSEFAPAIGLFIEVSNDKHSFVLQNFAPTTEDENFKYQQNNLDLMYRYIIKL